MSPPTDPADAMAIAGQAQQQAEQAPDMVQSALRIARTPRPVDPDPVASRASLSRMLDRTRGTMVGRMVDRYQQPAAGTATKRLHADLKGLAQEGEPGRMWYEKSSKRILDYVQGNRDEAHKLAQLIAIYSPQTAVDVNTQNAIKSYNRAKTMYDGARNGQPLWAGEILDRDRSFDTIKAANEYGKALNEQHGGGAHNVAVTKVPLDDSGKRFLFAKHNLAGYENIATADRDLKAHLLMNEGIPFDGRKTNNFYRNLMVHIDPTIDQGSTQDLWMARAFGFHSDEIGDNVKYDFMEKLTHKLGRELGWKPHQVQAAIWTAMKTRQEAVKEAARQEAVDKGLATMVPGTKGKLKFEIKEGQEDAYTSLVRERALGAVLDPGHIARSARDFSDFLDQNLAHVSWEATPSKQVAHLNGLEQLAPEKKADYHKRISEALQDDDGNDLLAKHLGLLSPGTVEAPGYWQGNVNPASHTQVATTRIKAAGQRPDIDAASKELLQVYADAKGLLLKQDGVGFHRPYYNPKVSAANGVEYRFDKPLTGEQIRRLGRHIDAIPDTALIPSGPNTMRIINFAGMDDHRPYHKAVDKALQDWHSGGIMAHKRIFASDGDLRTNDWTVNPHGEDYRSRLGAAGRSDVLRLISDVLAPKIEKVDKAFAQEHGLKTDDKLERAIRRPPSAQDEVAPLLRAAGGRLPLTAGERLVRALGGMAGCAPNGIWGGAGAPPPAVSGPGGAASAWGNFDAATYRGPMPSGGTMSAAAPTLSPPAMQNPFNSTTYGPDYPGGGAPPTMPFQQQSSGKGAGGAGGLADSGKGAGGSDGLTSLNAPPSYMGSQSSSYANPGGPMQATQQSYGIGNMLNSFMSRFGFADGGAVADDGTEWRNVNVSGEGASKNPVEVAINPTHDEITRLVKGSDRGAARLSKDTDGNVYAWDANRALHDHVQRAMGFKPDRKAASVIGQMPVARLHQGKLRLTDVMGMSFPGGVNGWHRVKRADGGEVGDPTQPPQQPPDAMVTPPSPSYIKPAPVDDYKRKLSPLGLYSHAAEAVWKQPQMKASPDQFKATLINKHGVKPDEFRWTGYDEAFKGRPMVTKREVRDHFLKNQPQLDERRYSDDDDYDYDSASGASGEPRYKDYALPGGTNYRELVVHLPKKTDPAVEKPLKEAHRATERQLSQAMIAEQRAGDELRHLFQFKQADDPKVVAATERYHAVRTAHEAARQAHDDATEKWNAVKNSGLHYQSSHWDDPNVVAHLRVSDRKTAPPAVVRHVVHNYVSGNKSQPFNTREEAEAFIRAQPAALRDKLAPSIVQQPLGKSQKILHLEELQSDWGQAGRDKGFREATPPRRLTPEEDAEQARLFEILPRDRTPEQEQRYRALRVISSAATPDDRLPLAPYVGATEKWTELGLKRALYEAARGGYDKLVITPGEEQAKRYDLSNHVDHISYAHQGNGLYGWSARKAGNEMASQRDQTLEQVAAYLGRDVAERMKQNAGRETGAPEGSGELRGLDLKVGGEGMRSFYDRLVPRTLEKLARQHDPAAKVNLFGHRLSGRKQRSLEEIDRDMDHLHTRGDINADPMLGRWHEHLQHERNQVQSAPTGQKLHSLDITPAMRASILEGQKSFASGGAVDPPGGKGFAEDLPYDDPGIVFVPDLDRVFGENSRIIGQKARYGTGKTGNEMFGFGNQDTLSAMSEGTRGAVDPPPSFPRWAGKQDKPFFSLHTHPSGSVHASRGDLDYRGRTNPDRHYMMLEAMSGPHNRTMIAPPRSLQGGFGPLAFKDYAGQLPFSRQATYDTLMKLNKSLGLDERDATMAGALVNLHLAKKGAPVFMDKRATPKGGKATVQEMLDDYVRHMKKYAWQDTPGLARGGAAAAGKRISERISEGVTDKIYRKARAEIPVFGRYKAGGST